MKKLSTMLILVCLLALALPVFAAGPYVTDEAGLFTQSEAEALAQTAQSISEKYATDVLIYTAQSLNGQRAIDYAAARFDEGGHGQGEQASGILLMLSPEARDWHMLTRGTAIDAFTDYALEKMDEDVVRYFSGEKYFAGFERFLRDAELCLAQAATGKPYDVSTPVQFRSALERTLALLPFLIGGALLVAVLGMLSLTSKMRTAVPQRGARHYVRDNSLMMKRSDDIFLYRTQTQRKRPQSSSSSSSGGSSTTRSSGGTKQGGRGGKY